MNDFQKNFIQAGMQLGFSQKDSEQLCTLLPQKLIDEAVTEPNSSIFGYVLLYNNPGIIENNLHGHNFKYLYLALHKAQKVMTQKQFETYCSKLKDRNRFNDFLYEMKPIFDAKDGLSIVYEPSLTQNPIDWCITINGVEYYIEVKNRIFDLINNFQQIMDNFKDGFVPDPPDVSKLFENIDKKYPHEKQENQRFGVWIGTRIIIHKKQAMEYLFKNLPQIDFVVFDNWSGNNASILVNDHKIAEDLSLSLKMSFDPKNKFGDFSQPIKIYST